MIIYTLICLGICAKLGLSPAKKKTFFFLGAQTTHGRPPGEVCSRRPTRSTKTIMGAHITLSPTPRHIERYCTVSVSLTQKMHEPEPCYGRLFLPGAHRIKENRHLAQLRL